MLYWQLTEITTAHRKRAMYSEMGLYTAAKQKKTRKIWLFMKMETLKSSQKKRLPQKSF